MKAASSEARNSCGVCDVPAVPWRWPGGHVAGGARASWSMRSSWAEPSMAIGVSIRPGMMALAGCRRGRRWWPGRG